MKNLKDENKYLNVKAFQKAIKAQKLTQAQIESDLGWGHGVIRNYVKFRDLMPAYRIKQLAKYLGVYPSMLYRTPSKAMIERHESYLNKRKEKRDGNSKFEERKTESNTDLEIMKILIVQCANSISKLNDKFEELNNLLASEQSKQQEIEDKRQIYLAKQIKEAIKKASCANNWQK